MAICSASLRLRSQTWVAFSLCVPFTTCILLCIFTWCLWSACSSNELQIAGLLLLCAVLGRTFVTRRRNSTNTNGSDCHTHHYCRVTRVLTKRTKQLAATYSQNCMTRRDS